MNTIAFCRSICDKEKKLYNHDTPSQCYKTFFFVTDNSSTVNCKEQSLKVLGVSISDEERKAL